MEVVNSTYLPGDPRLIDHIVYELKSQGIFDNFRKECIADVDTKPAYQNLRQRVEGSVSSFLKSQRWRSDMNKNHVREMLRKNISESGFLETGVERIVDQVVNPKINTIFLPQVENVVYKVLGIPKPTAFDDLKKEDHKDDIKLDLLPNDLEAISPESESQEKKLDISNESQKIDDKVEEDESPPFEPLEQTITHEENSVDSNLSGISGLVSHDSNQSVENGSKNLTAVDISNSDSLLSKQSSNDQLSIVISEDQEAKMEINDDSNVSKTSSTKQIDTNLKSVDVPDCQLSFEMMEITSTEKVDELKKTEEKHSSHKKVDKHHTSSRHSSHKSKYDSKDRKNDKDKKSDKEKKDHRGSKSSGSEKKDKDKKIKSDKDEKHVDSKSSKEKERERASSGHKHSKDKNSKRESQESKNKDSPGHKDNKKRTSESKSKDSKDRIKDEKSKSHSSSKKAKDDKSHSKHNGKSKSDSSDSSKVSSKDQKKNDKSDKKDKNKHSHSSDKKTDKGEKDKKDSRKDIRKDDHYSLKEKRTHRRSTDRDSSDGQSGTHSSSSSFTDLTILSQLQKSSQESSLVDSGASTGADSGNSDAIISLLSQNADIASIPCIVSEEENARVLSNKIPHLKLIKPKFASNIFEARRLMKIRKKLGKLEKQKQIELLRSSASLTESCHSNLNNHEISDNVAVDKITLKNKKNSTEIALIKINEKENQTIAQELIEAGNEVEEVTTVTVEETALQTSVISKESWDAIEAKLNAQNILKVDYNSYVDSSENLKDHKTEEKQMEASKEDVNIAKKEEPAEHNFKGFNNQLLEEAELCLKTLCETIAEWEADLAKLSKAYLIDLAEKDKSKKTNEEFNDFNRLPKIEIVDVTSNNEIIFSPGRGIKRIANDHTDVHNNNKISKELGDLLSEKINDVTGEQVAPPKQRSKKSKLMDNAVNTEENFNLPLSPAESDKSYNSINEKRNDVSEGRPRRNRATNKQRYSSDDLYKPRLQFTSTRRRTTNSEKN